MVFFIIIMNVYCFNTLTSLGLKSTSPVRWCIALHSPETDLLKMEGFSWFFHTSKEATFKSLFGTSVSQLASDD